MENKNIVNTEILGSKLTEESTERNPKNVQDAQELNASVAKNNILFAEGKLKLKRTIIASTIGGSLLAGILALASFGKRTLPIDEQETPVPHTNSAITHKDSLDTFLEDKKPVRINTEHDIYTKANDDKTLEEARELARKEVGHEALFVHKGELHPTMTSEEWNNLDDNEKLAFINKVNLEAPAQEKVEITSVDADGVSHNLVIDPLYNVGKLQFASDDSGHVFCLQQGKPAFELHNVTIDEQGGLMRTDPATGVISTFSIEEIFTKIDDDGAVNLNVSIPGIDEVTLDEPVSRDGLFPHSEDDVFDGTTSVSDTENSIVENHHTPISDVIHSTIDNVVVPIVEHKNIDVKNVIDDVVNPILENQNTPLSNIFHTVLNEVVDPLVEHKNPDILNVVSNIVTPLVENKDTPLANTVESILKDVVEPLAENQNIDTNNDNVDYGGVGAPTDLDNGIYTESQSEDVYAMVDNGNVDTGNNDEIITQESLDSYDHNNHPITDQDNHFNQEDSQ